ncbi:hypothetical protein Tco_1074435 [Tanacetum coccineum]
MVKKMNKLFNIAHTAENHRFVTLQKELSKVLQSKIDKSVEYKVSSGMKENKKDTDANTAGTQEEHQSANEIGPSDPTIENQREQPPSLEVAYKELTPPVSETKENKETAVVLHDSEKKESVKITLIKDSDDDDDLDQQPLSKRFKIVHPIPNIPTPTPLSSFISETLLKPEQ